MTLLHPYNTPGYRNVLLWKKVFFKFLTQEAQLTHTTDKHLQALQQLSAHLKLLLDAPEHLWRFMEQRTYLHAAWLYLTARAVHQTLLHGDEDVSRNWQAYGIDVSVCGIKEYQPAHTHGPL